MAAHSHLRDFFTFIGWGIAYGEIKQSPVDGSDIQAAGPLLVREMMAGKIAAGGWILLNSMILLVNEVEKWQLQSC